MVILISLTLSMESCKALKFDMSLTKETNLGVLQGETLTPIFINNLPRFHTAKISRSNERKWSHTKNERSRHYPPETIMNSDYTNNPGLLTNPLVQTECLIHCLEQTARGIGIYINLDKTKLMCFKQDGAILTLNDKPLKLVDHFINLSSNISSIKNDRYRKGMDCYQKVINHREI